MARSASVVGCSARGTIVMVDKKLVLLGQPSESESPRPVAHADRRIARSDTFMDRRSTTGC